MPQGQPEGVKASALEETREKLWQSIICKEIELRAAKTKYNATSFLNRLPVEILSKVFLDLASAIANDFILEPWLPKARAVSWIYVTHVCSHWREVALDCAALWSDIQYLKPPLAEAMLSRSKRAPLSFKLSRYLNFNGEFKDVIHKILSHSERLVSVEIGSCANAAILAHFSRAAPILEKLSLCGVYPAVDLTSTFLQAGAPSLKHLALSQFQIESWAVLPLGPCLTYLRIVGSAVQRPSASQFIASIHAMPHLQTLILENLLPEDEYPTDPVYNTIYPPPFAALGKLSLTDTVEHVTNFFSAVNLPETAKLLLEFSDSNSFDEDFLRDFLTNLGESWKGLKSGVQKLVMHEDFTIGVLTFEFYGGDCGEADTHRPGLTMEVGEWSPANVLQVDDFIVAFTAGMNLAPLQTLRISFFESTFFTPDMWVRAFSRFEQLQTMEFENSDSWEFLEALESDPAFKDERSPQAQEAAALSPHFPALTTIKFKVFDFECRIGSSAWDFVFFISDVLNRRVSCPPVGLEVSRCTNFSSAHCGELEILGVGITWDGYEDMVDSDGDEADSDSIDYDEDDSEEE
ncbi:hypothetical protein DFP72DRAFT_1163765 [Ephemerocybe angulata]|uniref:F-box domain-containing protein n=1 Tax=Ephemerocybe angulata TaxID=980116 RepID=A0A8H6IF44_9AGAR|nr:hypothetical protein DFP72DRAFT_1163765 [Tulosesus angulatus]